MPAKPKTAYQKLTLKQRLFVDAYLGRAHGNASQAARIAGYAHPKESGYQLLHQTPEVRAAIDERLKESVMSADEVLYRLQEIAYADIEDFISVGAPDLSEEAQQLLAMYLEQSDLALAELHGEGGMPIGLPEQIEVRREQLQQLAEQLREAIVSRPWRFDLEKAEREGKLHLIQELTETRDGGTKLKLAERVKALELLGRYHKLFTEKVEHTGKDGGPIEFKGLSFEEALKCLREDEKGQDAEHPGEDPGVQAVPA